MQSIETLLEKTLKAYREIEELEKEINWYYKEAQAVYEELDDEDKEFEKDYLDCITSYAT